MTKLFDMILDCEDLYFHSFSIIFRLNLEILNNYNVPNNDRRILQLNVFFSHFSDLFLWEKHVFISYELFHSLIHMDNSNRICCFCRRFLFKSIIFSVWIVYQVIFEVFLWFGQILSWILHEMAWGCLYS